RPRPSRPDPRSATARARRPTSARSFPGRARISWWLDATGRREGGQVESGIVIIHPGALGDVLQAVPALRGLRAVSASAPLVFAGQPRLGRLLVALGVVDEARGFDSLRLEALLTREPAPPTRVG